MGNQTSIVNETTKAPCTTAFTTGKLDITSGQRAILIVIDLTILIVNLIANLLSIYALVKSQQIKRRPSISLLVYLCMSDCSFAITAQTLFAVKIFHPELPCSFDLIVEFSTSVLADLSLCLVVLIAISRYIHTRHMIRVKQIITHTRVNIAFFLAFLVAGSMSLISLLADSNGDVDAYLQTEIFQTFIGVLLIVLVVLIYRRTELVAKRRKAVSSYMMHYTAYSEKVLRKIMLSTLCTLLPLRIPFFCSTVIKAVVSDRSGRRLSWWMQFTHLGCYALFCLSAGANALIFLYNNRHASKLIRFQWEKIAIFLGVRKQGSQVRPTPTEGVIPPLIQPVVTTGWYDQYVPTEAPTTLSTAVIGKKVWRDERREKRLKKKRRRMRQQRRLLQEKEMKDQQARANQEEPVQQPEKRMGWQLLKAYDRRRQEAEMIAAGIPISLLNTRGGPHEDHIVRGAASSSVFGGQREHHQPCEQRKCSSDEGVSGNDGCEYDPRSKRIGKYLIRFPPIFDRFVLNPRQRNSLKSQEEQQKQQQQQQQQQQRQQQDQQQQPGPSRLFVESGAEAGALPRDEIRSVVENEENASKKRVTFKIMSYQTSDN